MSEMWRCLMQLQAQSLVVHSGEVMLSFRPARVSCIQAANLCWYIRGWQSSLCRCINLKMDTNMSP